MPDLPVLKGCTPLSDVGRYVDKNIDLVGVVADFRPPMSSRGSDWTVAFTICDKSCPSTESGCCIRIFKPTVELLPQIRSNGDIILIRSVRVKYLGENLIAISSYSTSWVISYIPTHPKALPLVATYPSTTKAKPFELEHMKYLHDWWSASGGTTSSRAIPGSTYQDAGSNYQNIGVVNDRKRKFSLIRDMQFDCFYDIVGLVVKTFPGVGNYTVYVTDYSKNSMLHAYEWGKGATIGAGGDDDDYDYTGRGRTGGSRDWPGPWGQYTLQVTLWDVHAIAARKILYDGAYVRLQNVRAKRNGDGRLEGALHGDRRYPERVDLDVVSLDDPQVRQVIQRGKEYARRFENNKSRYEEEMQVKLAELKKKEVEKQARRDEGNKNVRCEKPGHPVTPISQILNPINSTAPFINRNYHIYCRVIDYLPKSLEDFSVPNKPSANQNKDDGAPTKPWVWRFALLVEGKDGATMRLIVEGNDAEYLLKMEAVNLRKDNRALRELREKLFVLWGDLEESRIQRDSNQSLKRNKRARHGNTKKRRECDELGKPLKHRDKDVDSDSSAHQSSEEDATKDGYAHGKMFGACVKEYGVPVGNGWKRLHKLFGTVIMM